MDAPAPLTQPPEAKGNEKRNMQDPNRQDVKDNSVPSLREFTQTSTFHGIRYVFEDTVWLRKLFWGLIIMGSVTFFVVQVGRRINDYYKYQTVTSVKSISSDALPFPAVTLCNLNQFRISETYTLGIYHYLDKQLRSSEKISFTGLDFVKNTSEVVGLLGHQLSQLIDKCTWQGETCHVIDDFQTRLLDIGLCHTFNFNVKGRKVVAQPGIEGALKLLLNIEMFEHMRGTNLDSGVKFLLHEPGETPSLKNLGFVATSGQHTFVAIKRKTMLGLPSPWGNCIENGKPVADCKHQCYTKDFIDHCNCTDTFMEAEPGISPCNFGNKLTCGCNAKNKDRSTCGIACKCSRPCNETTYKPTLSSSALSAINLHMFALQADGVYNSTKKAFQEASEIRLRLSDRISSDFLIPARSLVTLYNTVQDIHNHYNTSYNTSYMSLLLPFGESFYHSRNSLDPLVLVQNIRDSLKGEECGPEITDAGRLVDLAVSLLYTVGMEFGHLQADPAGCATSAVYTDFFTDSRCAEYYEAGLHADDSVCDFCSPSQLDGNQPCANVTNLRCVCCLVGHIRRLFQKSDPRTPIQYVIHDTRYFELMKYNSKQLYTDLMTDEAAYATMNADCEFIGQAVIGDPALFQPLFNNIQQFNQTSYNASSHAFFVNINFKTTINQFTAAKENYLTKRYSDVCCWQKQLVNFEYDMKYYNDTKYREETIKQEKENFEQALIRYQSLGVSELVTNIQDLQHSGLSKTLLPLQDEIDSMARYTSDSTYTTLELITDILEPSVARQVSSVITEGEREIETLINIQRGLDKVMANLEEFTTLINAGIIPLLRGSDLESSSLMLFLKDPKTEVAQREFGIDACDTLSFANPNFKDLQLHRRIACVLSHHLKFDIENLTQAVKEFEYNFNALRINLLDYYQDTQMNEDFYMKNFMQVDLYYETLQYEVTEEQEAFVIGSLFSEVGGFLGLLLGASVMTVCEVVDYTLLVLGKKLKKRNQLKPDLKEKINTKHVIVGHM